MDNRTAYISTPYQKVIIFRDCITGSSWVYDGPYDRAMLGQRKRSKNEEPLKLEEEEEEQQQPPQQQEEEEGKRVCFT